MYDITQLYTLHLFTVSFVLNINIRYSNMEEQEADTEYNQ